MGGYREALLALSLGFCPILSNQNQESEFAYGVSGWHPSQHMPSFRGLESWSNPFLGSSRSISRYEWRQCSAIGRKQCPYP